MKKKIILISISIFSIIWLQIKAQVIPDSLRVDWSAAGYSGSIPAPSLIVNVKNFGAYGDGVHDDYNAILDAINSSADFRVIFFPAGDYLIKSPIVPPNNIVFRGESEATNLMFDLSACAQKDAFRIVSNQTSAFTAINTGAKKGSSALTVSNPSGFIVNGYAEIRQMNGAWNTVPASWATYCVGQIVKIKAVNGNILTIEPALRIDYTDSLYPEIRPVTPKNNIGIECLKITRIDPPSNGKYGNNINFSFAVNCWVTGVELNKSQGAHIILASDKNITIKGCYIHDAFTYDGTGTAGYGITMIQHNSDCKVENCILKHLRHSMVAKQGANGNVFAYNYSLDPYRSEFPNDAGGDMLLHGHYAFANLFEGNIGQSIIVDDTWGPSGPYNTFFRNRAELYGIAIYNQAVTSDRQNVVGNEVTNSLKGSYTLSGKNQLAYDNNIKGTIQPAGTTTLNDVSYYLSSKPNFWDITSVWPSVGGSNTLNSGSNPAKERYLSNQSKLVCTEQPSFLHATISADSVTCFGGSTNITVTATGGTEPYLGTGIFPRPAGSYKFIVTDASGLSDTIYISIGQPEAITASFTIINASACDTSSGSIIINNVSGGTPPFQFSSNGIDYGSDTAFGKMSAGNYTVWIQDHRSCVDSATGLIISDIPEIIVSAKKTKASSCRDDGSITVKRTGGTAPFQYSLDGIDYSDNNIFYNLEPAVYTAFVKDKSGCIDSLKGIIITRAATLKFSTDKTNVTCKNGNDGTITVNAKGGITPYLYSMDSINFVSTNVFTNLQAGAHNVWVRDSRACTASRTVTIANSKITCNTLKDSISNSSQKNDDVQLQVSVLPNPSVKEFNITVMASNQEVVQIVVADMYGRIVYKTTRSPNISWQFGEKFAPGAYIIKITQNQSSKTFTIVKQ